MKLFFKIACVLIILICISCQKKMESNQFPDNAVVTSASPEATRAGIHILEKGGNAIDAAIAVQFALAVTEPAMSGLGGGTQVIFSMPGEKPTAINGASISPAGTPADATRGDLVYYRRSTIPSTVKVMGYIFEKYGSGKVSWDEILQPAISYAEKGFIMGNFRAKVYKRYEEALLESPYRTDYFLMPDGKIPVEGDSLKQPQLAETLKRLAKNGAKEFYQGDMAAEIANDMKENGGWITLSDLNNFPDPVEMEPVMTDFRGYQVYSQPFPCGGWTTLLILNMLEQFPSEELQPGTFSRFEKVLAALSLAHADRKMNPVTNELDLLEKLTPGYSEEVWKKGVNNEEDSNNSGGETTHYSVVDSDGMAVAVTSSINAYFGAKAATSGLGFLYNTYMDDFEFGDPENPHAIGPGKMNYSSMSPTIVQKNGKTKLIIGSPGSARIISSVAQLIQLWADTEVSIEDLVGSFRLHAINDKIYIEDKGIPVEWLKPFIDQGFEMGSYSEDLQKGKLNAYFGGIHAISLEEGNWVGAFDPRRDGMEGYFISLN